VSVRVLITRDPARAQELIERLAGKRIAAVAEPVTRTVFEPAVSLPPLEGFCWLAFTSVNAVTAFATTLKKHDTVLPAGIHIAAVGDATAAELGRRLRAPDAVAADSNAAELAETILHVDHNISGAALLWPCGAKANEEFVRRLSVAGVTVTPWICYSTEPVEAETLSRRLETLRPWDVALFAAPSAVRAFSAARPAPWDFECVAIGNSTAAALLKAGADRLIVCSGTRLIDQQNAVLEAAARCEVRTQQKANL
jgi:uroporphyrinogen-III synthase